MHEASIAQALFEAIYAEAKKQKGKPVAAKIGCGAFSGVNDEALRFAFEAISERTVCKNLKLTIEQKPIQARCKKNGHIYVLDLHKSRCPKCRCADFELLPDEPLLLEEITFEEKLNA
ncbi:MAG: hydrogenase maturation nickel metallochaperone HypA [Sedimentisphaerales bacterium]|jgi:hydrogenase nickel incorporation protein HypA/HybF